MTPPVATILIDILQFNHNVIHMQLKDITHADSLLQLPFRGNCMNWVIGHILTSRQEWLTLLGLPGIMSEAEYKTYGFGSEPITCPDPASPLESLVAKLNESLDALVGKLETITQEELDREVETWRGKQPLAQAMTFCQWHASYHTGQLEPLRQLAGKDDHVA
jgi:uncharacterized damage-inducible protein DinB